MTFFFKYFQSSSFQRFEDQPPSKAEFLSCNLLTFRCVSQFSDVDLYLFFFSFFPFSNLPVSACVFTQNRTLPVTHAAKHTQLICPFSRTRDTFSRTPGPAHWRIGGVLVVLVEEDSAQSGGAFHREEMNLAPQR